MRSSRLIPAVIALTLLLYALALDHTPPYLHEAEVLFGLHAHAIATTGHDLYGRFMPLYFQMRPLGENTWWHPLLVYLTALWLQVAPLTESMLRVPSALVGTVNVVLLYFIARRLFARRGLALFAAVLLAVTPAHFVQSRIAMDYIYPLPFVLGWTLALLRFFDDRRPRWLFVATSLLGIGTYSYIASVLMMPVYGLITIGVLIATRCRDRRVWLAGAGGYVWPLVILPVWLWFHPGVIDQTLVRYTPQEPTPVSGKTTGMSLLEALEELRKPEHFTSLPRRLSLYWYFFDPTYLFVTGGYASVMNSTRHVGVFLAPLLMLVPLGLWRVARRPDLGSVLVVLGFLTAPVAAVLAVPEPYAIDREMAVVPFGVLLACYGTEYALAAGSVWRRRLLFVVLLALPLHFAFFLFDYFVDYRPRAGFWFGLNHRAAVESVIRADGDSPAPAVYLSARNDPFLEAYWQFALAKWHREDLAARTVIDLPGTPARDVGAMAAGSLILINRNDPDTKDVLIRDDVVLVGNVPEVGDEQHYWVVRKNGR
jgi:4-amino-4-deoxy-L-arabinose transferase-like glycosyltransferase